MTRLGETLRAYQARDPAARSRLEIFLLYPGVHATLYHRLAHALYCHKLKFLARLVSQWSRFWTGIEIHPGATIGNNVLISTGAKVLGPFKVGDNSRIAANAVVLSEVPPDATAVGIPAQIVRIAGRSTHYADEVDQTSVKSPTLERLSALDHRVEALEKLLDEKREAVVSSADGAK